MQVSIRVPDRIGAKLQETGTDLERSTLEALAVRGYTQGLLTSAEVQEMLGLPSRWETDAFLKQSGGWVDYSERDLQEDRKALRGVRPL